MITRISQLVRQQLNQVKLDPAKVCMPIDEQTVSSLTLSSLQLGLTSSGGFASPLVEKSHTLHDPLNVVSSDGYFVLVFARKAEVLFNDANNDEKEIDFADPATE